MKTKKCRKCKQVKQVSEFHKNRTKKDGLHSYCKECKKQHNRKYRQTPKGKEANRKADKKYHQTHKEEINKYKKQYRMQHQISRRRDSAKHRGLGFRLIPPPEDFYEDDWFQQKLCFHHINDTDVVLIPEHLHKKYNGKSYTLEKHRNNLLPIIKEHYNKSNHAIVNKSGYII